MISASRVVMFSCRDFAVSGAIQDEVRLHGRRSGKRAASETLKSRKTLTDLLAA